MRNFTSYRHTWMINILPNFFDPLFYLVGIGIGLGAFINRSIQGTDYISFIAPGLMAAAAMNGASFETTYNMFVKMTYAKLYDAYLCTSAGVEDIVFGELCWALTRALIYGSGFFVILIGFSIFGYPILTSWTALAIPLALLLIGTLFGTIGQLFTAYIKKIDFYSFYFTLFLTPLFLFSGIFFPIDTFPYGREIAWWTPLYHAVHLLRGLANGNLEFSHFIDVVWMITVSWLAFRLTLPKLRRTMIP